MSSIPPIDLDILDAFACSKDCQTCRSRVADVKRIIIAVDPPQRRAFLAFTHMLLSIRQHS